MIPERRQTVKQEGNLNHRSSSFVVCDPKSSIALAFMSRFSTAANHRKLKHNCVEFLDGIHQDNIFGSSRHKVKHFCIQQASVRVSVYMWVGVVSRNDFNM
jgi:hypothetical protein